VQRAQATINKGATVANRDQPVISQGMLSVGAP